MNIVIVGASISGLISGILIKRRNPEYKILILDHNKKAGKKIYATGNGKCNILNKKISPKYFNNQNFLKQFDSVLNYECLNQLLNELGIDTVDEGNLIYPSSYSAKNVVEILEKQCKTLLIDVNLEEEVIDYDDSFVYSKSRRHPYDKLIFASGGKSQKNLGSDGSLFPIFKEHGYSIKELIPGLCPIKIKENVNEGCGCRHNALVECYENEKLIFSEEGEILFKKDGLSGIVIFNASRYLRNKNNCYLKIDFFPKLSLQNLNESLKRSQKYLGDSYLLSILVNQLWKIFKRTTVEETSKILKNFC